ncbi:chorismate mutase [Pontibacillus halophilus JSM 076056 = DSM 19796]|uniref:chorismate mutase n=1 Tax=Pontibacillus halophilus JSM 076056 = DSM 19796 TaxID=1385510 RepID=A0A0A5GJI9_9BACI|nr:chorismate mutase [Pontibacillus halophilus]KGX92159.1 chorismate mutase [Pontibacillus halophilus JSM 076056 = DSM 19796]
MIRGIRGATTVSVDDCQEILTNTETLLRKIIEVNQLEADQVASIFISATNDMKTAFPAKALRQIEGFTFVPIMCMQELEIEGGLERCIRVMMHVNTSVPQQEVQHVYFEEAVKLRPDLVKE